ncbi:hypothetical protein AUP42_12605 [Thalassospira lucentensis]|uniref:YjiS-like domain-containing protein n=1 Tax=Thalassospira lucentensis TaxID=168935 RepID=A0A154LA21_9PROT|nr:hypothetical protein AUP42_12605 [Thalassospira lucentensis]
MVNCNDTIRFPEINIKGNAQMNTKGAVKATTWRSAVAGIAVSVLERVRVWQESARNRRMLEQLDDHLLKDVGMTRSDLDRELSRPFWIGFPPRS